MSGAGVAEGEAAPEGVGVAMLPAPADDGASGGAAADADVSSRSPHHARTAINPTATATPTPRRPFMRARSEARAPGCLQTLRGESGYARVVEVPGLELMVALLVALAVTVAVVARLRQPQHRVVARAPWRVAAALVALGVLGATLWSARAHVLSCARRDDGVTCVLETKGLVTTTRRDVPGVVGAEVEQRVRLDRYDDSEQQARLWLVTREGRVAVAGFDEVDAPRLEREVTRFIADVRAPALRVGSDARPVRVAMAWTWLMVALSALFVRWDARSGRADAGGRG